MTSIVISKEINKRTASERYDLYQRAINDFYLKPTEFEHLFFMSLSDYELGQKIRSIFCKKHGIDLKTLRQHEVYKAIKCKMDILGFKKRLIEELEDNDCTEMLEQLAKLNKKFKKIIGE